MDLEKLLREAYTSGVAEAQIAEQIPNMSFDFDGMANAYAQSKVKNLGIHGVSNNEVALKAFVEEYIEAFEDGLGSDTALYRQAKSLL